MQGFIKWKADSYRQLALLVGQVLLSNYLLANVSLYHPTINIEHQHYE
jgi:hypothetical protein